ncbi:MAG: MFS transporter, partial [Thermoplasmata archaeon]
GYILDKFNRSLISFIFTIILSFSYSLLIFSNNLLLVYIVDIISSISSSITFDAFSTITKEVVDKEMYRNASAYLQISINFASIIGIITGGISIYLQNYFPYIITIFSLFAIFLNFPYKLKIEREKKYSYGDVIKFLKKFLTFLIIGLIINGLFVSIDVYSSGLIYFVLKSNFIFYTLFILGFSVGGFIGALWGNKVAKKLENALLLGIFIFLEGTFMIFIALNRIVIFDPILTFFMGFFVSLINIPITALFLTVVPNEMIGRFNSFVTMIIVGAQPLMATLFSILSNYFNISYIIFLTGLFMIIVSIPTYISINKLLKLLFSK